MPEYRVTEEAWRLLAKLTEANKQKLEGENSSRNDDGTYTIEVDADFNDKLTRAMKPGESLSACIVRHLKWINSLPN